MTTQQRTRRWRWGLAAASTVLLVAGASSLGIGSAADANTSIAPGQGSASAQSLAVQPHDGSLAVGAIFGEALAGHTNTFGRAQSQGIDLGSIGLSLTSGDNCGKPPVLAPDQIPQALQTETGAPGAAKGLSQSLTTGTNTQNTGTHSGSFGSTEFVQATGSPYAEADTSYAPVTIGPITVSGLASKAWSGIVNGQRVAGATSDIGSLSLIDGVVKLVGLHWSSIYPSSGGGKPTTSFSLGQVVINGTALPLNQSITALQTAINKVLSTLGIQLQLPVTSLAGGEQSVSALLLEVVPNTNRDALIEAINSSTEGLQQTVIGGLENGFSPSEPAPITSTLCETDTPITVAHVTIASVDGGGYFDTALGGVSATSGLTSGNAYNLGAAVPTLIPGTTTFIPGTSGVTSGPATVTPGPALPISGPAPSAGSGDNQVSLTPAASPVQPAAAVGYSHGGPLLAIALISLAALAVLVEGDRRMIRRRRHALFKE